jgi:hypothetical protein
MGTIEQSSHIHKLKRHRFKTGNTVYFCVASDKDCKVKFAPALALGKKSICWRCEQPFIMSEYSIRLAKPHCDKCHKPKVDYGALEIKHGLDENTIDYRAIQPATDSVSSLRNRLGQSLTKTEDEDI